MKSAASPASDAFRHQRKSAKRRGIAWDLTFSEWWDIWCASGKWELRGRGKGFYCMGRHGDVGPYAVGNVSILPYSDNARDGAFKMFALVNRRGYWLGQGRGWTKKGNRFQVKVRGRYLGSFLTEAEAAAAYRSAVSLVLHSSAPSPFFYPGEPLNSSQRS